MKTTEVSKDLIGRRCECIFTGMMVTGVIEDTEENEYSVNVDNYIYAYSQTDGQYRAPLSVNLPDKNNWSKVGGQGGEERLPAGGCC